MIKADQLREFRPTYRYQNGDGITLQSIQEALKDTAQKYGIAVAFTSDQIKSGGLFNSEVEDCLVLYHPEHPSDYFRFAIRVKRQGVMAFVTVNDFGNSAQMNKHLRSEANKEARKGQSLSYKLGNAAVSGLMNMGKNKNKLEEEQMYYGALESIFDEMIS